MTTPPTHDGAPGPFAGARIEIYVQEAFIGTDERLVLVHQAWGTAPDGTPLAWDDAHTEIPDAYDVPVPSVANEHSPDADVEQLATALQKAFPGAEVVWTFDGDPDQFEGQMTLTEVNVWPYYDDDHDSACEGH